MDPRRFDTLARSLAAPTSRRGLIGGLAALGASLLGARGTTNAQVSQVSCGNQFCASNPGGCKPGCVCCLYTNAVGQVTNSRCRPPGTCSPGAEVGGPTTAAPTTTTPPTTTTVAPTTTTTPAPTITTTTTTAAPTVCGGEVFGPCADGCACAFDVFFEIYFCVVDPLVEKPGICWETHWACEQGDACVQGPSGPGCFETCPTAG